MNTLQMFKRDVLLSIRPEFASKILGGEKTVELRRRFPTAAVIGARAIIYSSSPVQAIVGHARIENVLELPVKQIWHEYGKHACISKFRFNQYFEGVQIGFAIFLGDVVQFQNAIEAQTLKDEYDFLPPQSFRYLNDEFTYLLSDE